MYAPGAALKSRLRLLLIDLNELCVRDCGPHVHGFIPGRSPVTNAAEHIGFTYTITCDIKDFFDSVSSRQIPSCIWKHHGIILYDCHPRQGLPTSPAVCNLAAIPMDTALRNQCDILERRHGGRIVYTRYADDLTFSSDSLDALKSLRDSVATVLGWMGWKLNQKKTRIQWAGPDRTWRRVVTGVAVGNTGLHPTKRVRRQLRAAMHQRNMRQASGLAEWCRLRPPKPGKLRITKATLTLARHQERVLFERKPDVWDE